MFTFKLLLSEGLEKKYITYSDIVMVVHFDLR
jgi:hypothetical protein